MLRKLQRFAPHQKYFLRSGPNAGQEVIGSSGVSKVTDEVEGLLRYTWKQGKEGKPYGAERDDAADSGTIAHALAESFLLGDELDLSEFSDEAIRLGKIAFEKFREWWMKQGLTFRHAELQLVSHDHEYGGTLDIVGENIEKENCLIDLKATKSLRTAHGIQVAGGYAPLFNENFPDDPIDKVCILRIPKDDTDVEPAWINPQLFEYYRNTFLTSLAAFKARKILDQKCPFVKPWFKKGYKRK